MTKWNTYTTLAADELEDADLVPVSDDSESDGDKSKTTAIGSLRQFLGAGVTVAVTQSSHGLSVGDVIRHNGTSYVEATADTAANAEAIGIVTSVPDASTFTFQTAGLVTGLSGLTAGEAYYLQDAGGLGTTAGTVEKLVLVAVSTTSGVLVSIGQKGAAGDDGADAGTTVSINAQTGTSYTLVLTDAGKLITLSNASAITLTIPANSSVDFDAGTVIAAAQLGAGTVTVTGDTGVTVNGTSGGSVSLSGQYVTASLTQLSDDTWLVSGGLASE